MEDSWIKVLKEKAQEISLLANWAYQVDYDRIGDKLRLVKADLLE